MKSFGPGRSRRLPIRGASVPMQLLYGLEPGAVTYRPSMRYANRRLIGDKVNCNLRMLLYPGNERIDI